MYIANPMQPPADVFMYMLRPARPEMLIEGPTAEEQALAGRHWMHSQELLRQGTIIFAGRTLDAGPGTFAMVVVRADSLDAAREIMDNDPAVREGLFRATLYGYEPMLIGEWTPGAWAGSQTPGSVLG